MYAFQQNLIPVSNKRLFFHVLQFAVNIVNNFVPFDSLLATLSSESRSFPPQWFPLMTGLANCLAGGLYRQSIKDTLMEPADALGIAVHLFGLAAELHYSFLH